MSPTHARGSSIATDGHCTKKIPLLISYGILLITWPAFVIVLSINGVLRRNGEWMHFIEQQLVYHSLLFMSLVSLYLASTTSPGRPDQSLAPSDARPPISDDEQPLQTPVGVDDDDVPLRALQSRKWVEARENKERPSPLPISESRDHHSGSSESSADLFPTMTPFPFAPSPFFPTLAIEAGASAESSVARQLPELDLEQEAGLDSDDRQESDQLLENNESRIRSASLTAKASTGGPRWCKKCKGWKPDRCHHCRFCHQCTLKMDHHCVWIANCVGYSNYKPFILFVTYGALLAIYCGLEAGFETYRFFSNPSAFVTNLPVPPKQPCPADKACPPRYARTEEVDFAPVVYLILTIMGVFLTLSVGGLAGYHWYLVANNKTTLENITHAFPAALLPEEEAHSGAPKSASRSRWRPEHLLTRQERVRMREEAREINVYDLGWRRNIKDIMVGQHAAWWTLAVPWLRPKSGFFDAGHSFPYDDQALQRLRALTMELRLAPRASEPAQSGYEDEDDNEEEDYGERMSAHSHDRRGVSNDGRQMKEVGGRNPHVAWFDAGTSA